MKHTYKLIATHVKEPLQVIVVGAGGTGARLLEGLASTNYALKALGRPGLNVTVFDDDVVSEFNIGRQPYYPCDIGKYKAEVLVNRINLCYGTHWRSVTQRFDAEYKGAGSEVLIIGCVDLVASRRSIESWIKSSAIRKIYWLDCGNRAHDGQVVLGYWDARVDRLQGLEKMTLLPLVTELYPDLMKEGVTEGDTPSCSMREALEKQSLFINRKIADTANSMLWNLFKDGGVDNCVSFLNLKTNRESPMPVNYQKWIAFGMQPVEKEPA